MLCVIGAGSTPSELAKALEEYQNSLGRVMRNRIRKSYTVGAESDEIQSELQGCWNNFHVKEIIEEPTLRDIFNLLSHPEGKGLLPNPPLDKDKYDCFQRSNETIADLRRNWVQFDIDWRLVEGQTMTMPFEDRVKYALKRLGIPAGVGYVAQLSSSGWVADERKPEGKQELSIRLYFILETPMNQRELQEAFRDVDVDESMFQHARLHIVDYPSLDEDIKIFETNESVILKNGDKLNPSVLPKTKINDHSYNPATPGQKRKFQNAIQRPNLFSLMRLGGYDFNNPYDHLAYYENNADTLDGRNFLFYETLKLCYRMSGTFEPFLEEWNKERDDAKKEVWDKIRGQHKKSYLNSKMKAIKKEFLDETTCGDVRKSFEGKDKTIIQVNTDYIYEDEKKVDTELREWEKNGGILLMKAGCGSGKTQYVLNRAYHVANRPGRYCFITFRKALIDQTISKCKEKKQTFKPYHYETWGMHREFNDNVPWKGSMAPDDIRKRKEKNLPDANKLIICVDSLHYLQNNGIENPFEVVFIDEIEHVLEKLWEEADAKDFDTVMESRESKWLQLIKLCAKAKYVILADDKSSNVLTGWFVDEVAKYSGRKAWLLLNEKDLLSKKTVIDISRKATGFHLVKIKRLVSEGKVVALQTNRKVDSLRADISALVEAGIPKEQIFAIDSQMTFSSMTEDYNLAMGSDAHLGNDYRKNPNKVIPWLIEKGVKVFIHSPWNGVGWDYDGKGIDAVFVKLLWLPKIDSKDAIQYATRFRLCDTIYIDLPTKDMGKYQEILEKFEGESRRQK